MEALICENAPFASICQSNINIDNVIGITSTVPIEIIFAGGYTPIDLNNVFITDNDPYAMVEAAELEGFPGNACAWIKGIYSAAKKLGIRRVVGVVQGDCSNTNALLDIFRSEGIEVIPFAYPYKRNQESMDSHLRDFADQIGVDYDKAQEVKERLDAIREIVHEIDYLTWHEDKVTGDENHKWTVSASDMFGDYNLYAERARGFCDNARCRLRLKYKTRLGYIGIPPICNDIYPFLGELGCHVVFNEVQRQFSMPYKTLTLAEQYTRYTYPYDIFCQIEDIRGEIIRRKIDGIIHYVQSFCHRPIYKKIIRKSINVPMITLDFDKPGSLNGAMKTRLEAFVEMLAD